MRRRRLPQPAKGTGVIFVLVRKMNSSRLRWLAVPFARRADAHLPGFAFAIRDELLDGLPRDSAFTTSSG